MLLKEYLIRNSQKEANITEFAITATLLATSCLAIACQPLLVGIGSYIEEKGKQRRDKQDKPQGSTFWDYLMDTREKRREDKENKKREKEEKQQDKRDNDLINDQMKVMSENFDKLLMISKQQNEKEKNENTKKKNDAVMKLLIAGTYDKEGKQVPLDKRLDNIKDMVPPEQFEQFKKDMTAEYKKCENDKEFQKALKTAVKNIKKEKYQKFVEDSKKEAKQTLEQLEKECKELEKKEKELDALTSDKAKKEEIEKKEKEIEDLNKKSLFAEITNGSSGKDKDKDKEEKKDKDKDKEEKKDKDKDKEEKKDKDGNIIKQEEVTDDKGKKIKVTTHTGPRGGKFYYPEGKPKTPEHKVYIKKGKVAEGLVEFLRNSIKA